jgi:recombination protein RecR
MNFSSKLIEEAVEAFATLPSIGKKTALRLVLHLIKQEPEISEQFADAILRMRKNIKECKKCHNISDHDLCSICKDPKRDASVVCVVETIRDVMAIEDTGQFRGSYHVLGGVISPIEGDTTIFYITKQLKDLDVKVSTIARGISFGGELEYADELTLGRSIIARTPYRLNNG